MFEAAELGHEIDKETYDREEPELREALLAAQYELLDKRDFRVVVVVGGAEGAGKSETVSLFNEWMDPRHIQTHGFGEPSEDERERPPMWRFWQALPPRGTVGIMYGSWYGMPLLARIQGKCTKAELDQEIERTLRFERMLVHEDTLLVKLWFHLSRRQQKRRLRKLEKDPDTRWRITDYDWRLHDLYDEYRRAGQHVVRLTSTGEAPWAVIEGVDARYRGLTAGRTLLASLRDRLAATPVPAPDRTPPLAPRLDGRDVLSTLDYTRSLEREAYQAEREKWQGRLALGCRHKRFRKRGAVVVFEGADAAGKGGAIRRITQALDARFYRVVPVAAPTDEERAQPYLWRFWRHLPRRGRLTVFDRSWYGRVLVERVEGLCTEADWMRAYGEINDFEDELARHGLVVVKFWLAITKEEQLRRFTERQQIDYKRFKITDEDWRNRDKWDLYHEAVCDMVERTSTGAAPWTLVEANDKYHARIVVLKTLGQRIEDAL